MKNQVISTKENQEQTQDEIVHYPSTTIEATYPYSVRVEQCAKGARVSVHCYNRHLELGSKGGDRGLLRYSQAVKGNGP